MPGMLLLTFPVSLYTEALALLFFEKQPQLLSFHSRTLQSCFSSKLQKSVLVLLLYLLLPSVLTV